MSTNFPDADSTEDGVQASDRSQSVERALTCLNQYSSFLAFEQLDGTASHRSRAFHCLSTENLFGLVSAWQANKSKEQNDINAARLLVGLASKGAQSIQILAHRCQSPQVDENPVRAFLIINPAVSGKNYKERQLALCKKYNQPAVAFYEHREIRLFDSTGEVAKGFNLKTLEARHLKRILASLVDLKLEWLESGYFSASPVYLCAMVYNKAGLESDVPIQMMNRVYTKAQGLVRYRPHEKQYEAQG
jgi:hypothetical protein